SLLLVIRRIDKRNVGWVISQQNCRTSAHNRNLVFADLQRRHILANGLQRLAMTFNQCHVFRSAAQRFNPHCARSRIGVEKSRSLNPRCEHVEQRFPQSVRGWPPPQARNALQSPAAESPPNHSHTRLSLPERSRIAAASAPECNERPRAVPQCRVGSR